MLNSEFKKEWIKALRGPFYNQCSGHISHMGAYCCLGVAICVYNKNPENVDISFDNVDIYNTIKNKIGLVRDQTRKLIELNDHEKKNFREIADWIETNL